MYFREGTCVVMNKNDFDAIDRAIMQQIINGKVTERCPRCKKTLIYTQLGTSYEVKCPTPKCISEIFRGI